MTTQFENQQPAAADPVRAMILHKIAERDDLTLKSASLAIGMSHAYLQQFIRRGVPGTLPEDVRGRLATLLGVKEDDLRHPGGKRRLTLSGGVPLPPPNARPWGPLPLGGNYVPVYGQASGGKDGQFVLNGNKITDILAPPSLAGVPDAYAVYVVGDSMDPRYLSGEVVFVNPRLPVRKGDFVVAQIQAKHEGDPPDGYVKRFVSKDTSHLNLEHNEEEAELRCQADRNGAPDQRGGNQPVGARRSGRISGHPRLEFRSPTRSG